ncbi:MAG: glutamate--tRNA ligase [Brevinematales bacterium]|nr:glutamate--tRNA ligase [Brevinematales bacterium]
MVRTRFAPSPTGQLHVGNVRTALFAYLYARKHHGQFLLRIEDTDSERSEAIYTEKLMDDLRWLGLTWDEGPDKGGPYGPYAQSERLSLYHEYAKKLIDEGRAYYCYCTPEEVEASKQKMLAEGKPPHYDGRCRHLSRSQREAFEKEGRKPAIRFVAYDQEYRLQDVVKGEVHFPRGMVGDFVIIRSNGLPVYNYAVVIDDYLMKITHVLRGDDHLSNTVRQLMIYQALGAPVPVFGHMALVLGPDKQKLSKRHGVTSIEEFRRLGYPPEALLNYLSLLGWSSPDGREILSMEELIHLFDLDRLSSSPAVFDYDKLDWISKHYIIQMPLERLYEMAIPFFVETGWVTENDLRDPEKKTFYLGVLDLIRGYCHRLADIKDHLVYFLQENFPIEPEAEPFLALETTPKVLHTFYENLQKENREIDELVFREMAMNMMKETGVKGKNFFLPLRIAITGRVSGPEIYFILPLIGKEKALQRISHLMMKLSQR